MHSWVYLQYLSSTGITRWICCLLMCCNCSLLMYIFSFHKKFMLYVYVHSEFILNLNLTKHISSYRLVSPLFVDKLLTLFIFLFLFCDTLVDWLSRVVIVTKMIASFSNLWSSVFKICKRSLYLYIHALCFHYF